jgi:hypothetical protein
MTGYELALNREQEISLVLIQFLRDPGLVSFFLKILQKVELDNDQDFHCSLRRKTAEQWEKLNELCKKKKFYQMNPSIPITCDLPFDGDKWRNSKELMKHIDCFFPGFIILECNVQPEDGGDYLITSPIEDLVVGVRKCLDVQIPEDLRDTLFIKDKVDAIDEVSFGNGRVMKAYRKFREIVDSYDNYDMERWTDEDKDDCPRLIKNLTTGVSPNMWIANDDGEIFNVLDLLP